MQQLEGRGAVITGAGSGIGAAVARACAAAGMAVAVVDVDRGRAEKVCGELEAGGQRTAAFAVDVSDAGAVAVLAEEVFARFGGCHLLHNNAGLCPVGRSWEHSADEWLHVLGVNLLGVVNGVNAFVPRLIAQGGPAHVVNTASAAALRYVPSSALYNATKFGVVALSESLRRELEPHGIGVSVLCPGGVATNINETLHGTLGHRRSDAEVGELLAAFATIDATHSTTIAPERVAELVLEGVRRGDFYVVTHPGSLPAVAERHAGIESAYRSQRQRHPELP